MTNRVARYEEKERSVPPTVEERARFVLDYFAGVVKDGSVTSLYAPDAELVYFGDHRLAGRYSGVAEIGRLFQTSRAAFGTPLRLDVRDVLSSSDRVLALLAAAPAGSAADVPSWPRVVIFKLSDELTILEQWIVDGDGGRIKGLIGGLDGPSTP